MTTRVIQIPTTTVHALSLVFAPPTGPALVRQGIHLRSQSRSGAPAHELQAVHNVLTATGMDRRLGLTAVLTDQPIVLAMPAPVPVPILDQQVDLLFNALLGCASLTGHEKLQLTEALQASPIQAWPLPGRFEVDKISQWQQQRRGLAIGAALAGELARFDADLRTYDPSVGDTVTHGLISALGWQAGLARYLAEAGIAAGDGTAFAGLLARNDPAFAAARILAEGLIEGHGEGLAALDLFRPYRYRCISAQFMQAVHGHVFSGILPETEVGMFRKHDGGFDLETGERGVPHQAIRDQLRRHTTIYGFKSWPDCHAIVRAGLAHLHLMRTRPFKEGNGEIGRILISLRLQDRGIPELPLDLVLCQRADEYRAAVRAALDTGDALAFVRFLTEACHQALHLGQEMATCLRAEISQLEAVLSGMAQPGLDPEQLAMFICSRLALEDHHLVFASPAEPDAAIAAARALAQAGHLEEIVVGQDTYWSSPKVRILLARIMGSLPEPQVTD